MMICGVALLIPQGTNIARAVGFNRVKVKEFFMAYKELLENHTYTASKVWNINETGIAKVHPPSNSIATKVIRQVEKMTSRERGATVTVICALNVSGRFLRSMLIFPRKRTQGHLMLGVPSQSVGYCSANGWTDSDMFVKSLEHFVANARTCTVHVNSFIQVVVP